MAPRGWPAGLATGGTVLVTSLSARPEAVALAKRLGNDLLQVMEREIRLKERYFLEMNAIVGSVPAARFLAWEDYYSVVCKMYAWAETP